MLLNAQRSNKSMVCVPSEGTKSSRLYEDDIESELRATFRPVSLVVEAMSKKSWCSVKRVEPRRAT